MEEQKKAARSSAEIQNEYQNLCARAGHIQYTIDVMQKDLERMNAALRDLNNEHAQVKQAEAAAAEAAAKLSEVKNESQG